MRFPEVNLVDRCRSLQLRCNFLAFSVLVMCKFRAQGRLREFSDAVFFQTPKYKFFETKIYDYCNKAPSASIFVPERYVFS